MESSPQFELPGLPPRTAASPVETQEELQTAMSQILTNLKPHERVTICLDLINFTGELCLTENPTRLVDQRKKPMNARKILVDRNGFLKVMLESLQAAK
jgi:hypothetical protein